MTQGFAREARIGVDLHVGETLYYTANDTFAKADYPGLYGVRVKVQAAGAAGGAGVATGAGECSSGAGGSGGGYAESIIEAADLGTSESITVGSGGSGNTTGTGDNGGDSSFGTHVTATGGSGGATVKTSGTAGAAGPAGGGASGDLVLPGGAAEGRFVNGAEDFTTAGEGGSSTLGNPGSGGIRFGAGGITAAAGTGYGAGGSGAAVTESSTARAGGDGADGIVIVEVLYERKIAVDEDIHTQYLLRSDFDIVRGVHQGADVTNTGAEEVHSTVTLNIPADWNTYDVEFHYNVTWIDASGGNTGATQLATLRCRLDGLTGTPVGDIVQVETTDSNIRDVQNAAMTVVATGETTTGSRTFVGTVSGGATYSIRAFRGCFTVWCVRTS